MTPSRSTTAPTGTSPVDAARRASSSAAAIPGPSAMEAGRGRFPFPVSRVPAFLCTRRFGRRRRHALEGAGVAVFRSAHADAAALDKLPLEPGERDRRLHQPLNRPLERTGGIHLVLS